jgi:hypothetical protein
MKIMLRAVIAAVSFASIGPAHADEGIVAKALSVEIPAVTAQAPARATSWP